MNLKKINITIVTLMVGAIFSGSALSAEQIVAKFSHVASPNSAKGLAADYFKKEVERVTNNAIKVEVYPNSTLFKDKEEMEALNNDNVQFLAPSVSKFASLGVKEFEVFDLPYMFENPESVHKITEGEIGKKLFSSLEPKGFVGLGYWDAGFKQFSNNKKLTNVSDFKNQKFRIQSSKVLAAQMSALGAKGIPMAFSEVYNALADGLVDGTENPNSNFYTQRFYEVQKFLTVSDHGYLGYGLITNKKFWDKIPKDLQPKIIEAAKNSVKYANNVAKEQSDKDLSLIAKTGDTTVVNLTPSEKSALKTALQIPVQKEMTSRLGLELIQSINKEVGNKEAFDALQSVKK